MAESFTWRNLLAQIISKPHERYQLAHKLNVHPLTLTRWSTGVSVPRLEALHRLVAALPAYEEQLRLLVMQEIPQFSSGNAVLVQQMAEHIPSSLYSEIFSLRATTSPEFRCWAITERLLSVLLEQLDAQQVGVMALLALCTPPVAEKPVRSLHIFTGQVLPQRWGQKLQQINPFLFGVESLSGYAIQTNRMQSLYNRETSDLPGVRVIGMKSAIACPIRSFSRIAGCLYVGSQQVDYFLAPQLQLIDAYVELASLALDEHDFYEPERISLALFPPGEEQTPLVQAVQYQMTHQAGGRPDFPVPQTPRQVELEFWQRVERQILDGGESKRS
jgi:hypothetical protein